MQHGNVVEPHRFAGGGVLVDRLARGGGAQRVPVVPGGLDAVAGAITHDRIPVVGAENPLPRLPKFRVEVPSDAPAAGGELRAQRGIDELVDPAGVGQHGRAQGGGGADAMEEHLHGPTGLV